MKVNTLLLQNGNLPYPTENNNEFEFLQEYEKYTNICLSLFEWENLPPSIRPEFIEETLYYFGFGMFVFDDTLGFIFVPCSPSDEINFQNEPLKYISKAKNYTKEYDKEDVIIIPNNPSWHDNRLKIINYCNKLAECTNTSLINILAQKTPTLILCDDKDRLTLENTYKQYKGNNPVIYADKSFTKENITVLKTDAPFVADKILDYKHELRNELLTDLGINNSNTDKKERLITNEVDSNNMEIEINKQVMLKSRQKACEKINKKFGLNISVKFALDDIINVEGLKEVTKNE